MHLHEDNLAPGRQSQPVTPLRLLLVDDHLMVTEALASRLSSAPDLWVAGRSTTAEPNLLDIVRGLRPDVITIEVEPLGAAIGEFLERLVAVRPEARVVVLSADHDQAHAVEAARPGVSAGPLGSAPGGFVPEAGRGGDPGSFSTSRGPGHEAKFRWPVLA